jgi:hypothetical protein
MFRLTLPKVAHKTVTQSPLPIGLGDDASVELDNSLNIELINSSKSS